MEKAYFYCFERVPRDVTAFYIICSTEHSLEIFRIYDHCQLCRKPSHVTTTNILL